MFSDWTESSSSQIALNLRHKDNRIICIGLSKRGTSDVAVSNKTSSLRCVMDPDSCDRLIASLGNRQNLQAFVNAIRKQHKLMDEIDRVNVVVRLTEPMKQKIDYKWNYRIGILLQINVEKEKLVWILSTLGGALSAMGDYYQHFAQKAELVSYRQLQLANNIGDPSLIAHCKLYIAISLMQRLQFRSAAAIIRSQYNFAKSTNDAFLINVCSGVWAKLVWSMRINRKRRCLDAIAEGD